MSTLRHNKLASLLLVLAVVFSALGWPAAALACRSADARTVQTASAAAHCSMPDKTSACCCPKVCASADQASARGPGVRLEAKQCPCSIQAPSTPPAVSLKAALPVSTLQMALLPAAPFQAHLPAGQGWVFAALPVGPPGGRALPSAPSRAPPVCL